MEKALVWLRRDLRTFDHAALSAALQVADQVYLCFIFDTNILNPLLDKGLTTDRRVDFIWQSIGQIHAELIAKNPKSGLIVLHGNPQVLIPELAKELAVDAVLTNHDYEPSSIARDALVANQLKDLGIDFTSYKDQVIFERKEVLTGAGGVFSVFTPFKNAWLKKLTPQDIASQDCFTSEQQSQQLAPLPKTILGKATEIPTLEAMGFTPSNIQELIPIGMHGASQLLSDFEDRIHQYQATRDFPAIKGPSYLSTHLRFGTVSIRALVRIAHHLMLSGSSGASTWLSELIWRDFYFMILANHPRLASGVSFKPDYDKINWEQGLLPENFFKAWTLGKTGYPLVDAAMRQLNTSGYMHNRLRMVAACFLIKDLGVDWRLGEAYFADQLNDYDFAANNGGWQWASSSGCDAQPYFRIFNPITQSQKFDKEGKFIRKYCPELAGLSNQSIHAPWLAGEIELQAAKLELGKDYPFPIIKHDEARKTTLLRYSVVKAEANSLTNA